MSQPNQHQQRIGQSLAAAPIPVEGIVIDEQRIIKATVEGLELVAKCLNIPVSQLVRKLSHHYGEAWCTFIEEHYAHYAPSGELQ